MWTLTFINCHHNLHKNRQKHRVQRRFRISCKRELIKKSFFISFIRLNALNAVTKRAAIHVSLTNKIFFLQQTSFQKVELRWRTKVLIVTSKLRKSMKRDAICKQPHNRFFFVFPGDWGTKKLLNHYVLENRHVKVFDYLGLALKVALFKHWMGHPSYVVFYKQKLHPSWFPFLFSVFPHFHFLFHSLPESYQNAI